MLTEFTKVRREEINPGEAFKINSHVFLAIEADNDWSEIANSVRLMDGIMCSISPCAMVEKLNAKVVVS